METIVYQNQRVTQALEGARGVKNLSFPNHRRAYSSLSASQKAKISESRTGKRKVMLTAKIPKDLPAPHKVWNESQILNYHRVAAIIFQKCRRFGYRNKDLVSIHSNSFAGIDDYRKYIDHLIRAEVLKIDEQYRFNQPESISEAKSKTKGYRLADWFIYQRSKDLIVVKFATFRKTKEQLALSPRSEPYNEVEKLMEKIMIEHTTVNQDFLEAGLAEESYNWLERLNYGITSITQSRKTGRLFSNVTFMSKAARKYIMLDGEETVSIDYKSLHPYICYSLMTSENEKAAWKKICEETGFYEWMMQVLKTSDRDFVKEVFQIYLAQKGEFRGTVLTFQRVMTKKFPIFDQYVRLTRSISRPMQGILQGSESGLVIETIFKTLAKHGVVTLPVHDALIVKKSQAKQLAELMQRKALERWKIQVPVEFEK